MHLSPPLLTGKTPFVHPDPRLIGSAPEKHQTDDRRPIHLQHGQSSRHPRLGDLGDYQTTPATDAGDEKDTRSTTPMRPLVPQWAAVTDQPRLGPFTQEVHEVPFPSNFRLPHFERADGRIDPEDHVGSFEIQMQLFGVDDAIMCRVFPATFTGAARRWYTSLAPQSISHFSQLREAFVSQFASSCTPSRAVASLFSIGQQTDESLRDFTVRFNRTYIQIPGLSGELAMTAVLTGLCCGAFLDDLTLRPPHSFTELLQRARSFMTLEDQTRTRMTFDSRVRHRREFSEDHSDSSPERRHHRSRRSRRHHSRSHRTDHPWEEPTPQAPPSEQIFMGSADLEEFTREERRWELANRQRPQRTQRNDSGRRWCMFHQECRHST
ncbi:hypothetical protein Dimus_038290 [Dionaea muscipula]